MALAAVLAAILPPSVAARGVAPPGLSEADQYFETLPTPSGPRSGSPGTPAEAVDEGKLSAATAEGLEARGPAARALAGAVAGTAPTRAREGGDRPGQAAGPAPEERGLGDGFPLVLAVIAIAAIAFALRRRGSASLALLPVLAALALVAPQQASAAPHGLRLGLRDDSFNGAGGAALREEWMGRAKRAGADLVSLYVGWRGIAPASPPEGFRPADPADPSYRWQALDGAVRAAAARDLAPLLVVNHAPAWAEGPGRPLAPAAPGGWLPPAGTWRPLPRQLGWFARALAARYSGRFADPSRPAAGPLPRVRHFQIWGEQNQALNLNPLWNGSAPIAAAHYRAMLNAAYAGVHRAQPGARVLVGGTAPYGDLRPEGFRIPPVTFWRALLCLRDSGPAPARCPGPARFDIAAHNPINVGAPDRRASKLNASTPDIDRLTRIVRRAVRAGRALPARPKPLWATEIWWDSDPPDPRGVPLRRHARYLVRSLFVLWRQGVRAVVWWYLRDQDPGPGNYAGTQQSGLFFRDGRPKPALRAFRFPFLAGRAAGGRILLWGKAPRAGRLVVERRTRRGWAPLARLRAGPSRVFLARLPARGAPLLRARQGRSRSLPWQM